jgi:hypothetical protein
MAGKIAYAAERRLVCAYMAHDLLRHPVTEPQLWTDAPAAELISMCDEAVRRCPIVAEDGAIVE